MSKIWKVNDGWTENRRTTDNRPWLKLTWSKAPGEVTNEDLQDGCRGGHLRYRNKMLLFSFCNYESPCRPKASHQVKAQFDLPFGRRLVWRFSRWPLWCHLGYWNRTILAILNQCVAPLPPIKFRLNTTYGLGGYVFEEFQDDCCEGHLGYQNGTIIAILNLYVSPLPPIKFKLNTTPFGSRCHFHIFKMAIMAATLDIRTEGF